MNSQRIKKAKEKISPKPSKIRINEEQQRINEGQRDINGALCYVDWHVIKALQTLTGALEDAGVLTASQLYEVKKELGRAYYTSVRVAEIDPPGCGTNFEKEDDEEDPAVFKAA
jgi:hypothetical protein